jgi:hypothetical protein
MKMKYKNITQRKNERAKRLKKLERWCELSKVIAIVGILWSMTGCATKYETGTKIVNNCLDTAESYGDYVECAIQLDEAQY